MLLLLFSGAKSSAPPPLTSNALQTVLTRWDFERFKRRPVFKTLLEEAEYDLKQAYEKLQSVAFNKRPEARQRYEELKEIVEVLRNDNLFRQRIKRAQDQAIKAKLKSDKRLNELRKITGVGLLSAGFFEHKK